MKYCQALVRSPVPLDPIPKPKVQFGLGLTLKSHGPQPPPLTFRGPECAYMVQIDALSTPECQEGVQSHSRWTARGRTWGSPPSTKRTL